MADKKLSLKLMVDRKKNRIVCAETESDFVDVLLSFLTLPMGTIIRLYRKRSEIGSMHNLYKSVEALDVKYLNTQACKAMLLSPRMERLSEHKCRNLVYDMDDEEHKIYYKCPSWVCRTETHCLISMVSNTRCQCGEVMSKPVTLLTKDEGDGFVKRTQRYMIRDNLNVTPASTTTSFSLLSKLGITDSKTIQEMDINVGRKEVLDLIKHTFRSKTPMEDVFLQRNFLHLLKRFICLKALKAKAVLQPLKIKSVSHEPKENIISVKLLFSRSKNKVLYVEAREDFLDLLFSFLTFPLGSIQKLFFSDAYKYLETLCYDDNAILEESKDLLLNPKIAFQHGINNQLLKIEEESPRTTVTLKCKDCYDKNVNSCLHGLGNSTNKFTNPKFVNTGTESGGGYVKGPCTFMVTDDLVVKPFSLVSSMAFLSNLGLSSSDLEEKVMSIGEYEALAILMASYTSKTVFTQVFCENRTLQKEGKYRHSS